MLCCVYPTKLQDVPIAIRMQFTCCRSKITVALSGTPRGSHVALPADLWITKACRPSQALHSQLATHAPKHNSLQYQLTRLFDRMWASGGCSRFFR